MFSCYDDWFEILFSLELRDLTCYYRRMIVETICRSSQNWIYEFLPTVCCEFTGHLNTIMKINLPTLLQGNSNVLVVKSIGCLWNLHTFWTVIFNHARTRSCGMIHISGSNGVIHSCSKLLSFVNTSISLKRFLYKLFLILWWLVRTWTFAGIRQLLTLLWFWLNLKIFLSIGWLLFVYLIASKVF